jgi:hypothetical protein
LRHFHDSLTALINTIQFERLLSHLTDKRKLKQNTVVMRRMSTTAHEQKGFDKKSGSWGYDLMRLVPMCEIFLLDL